AREILQRAGCVVTEADSGKNAIQTFRDNPSFELILMDIQMPEMDGIETTAKLRKEFGQNLPNVVAMTAYSMQNDREKFLSSGFNGYVSKPIRANTLILAVEEMLLPGHKPEEKSPSPVVSNEEAIPAFDMEIIN